MRLLQFGGSLGATLHRCRRQNAGTKMLATAGTPRPWTFFRCRGRSPGSQVVVAPGLPNAEAASVTFGRAKLAAYSCGGSAGILRTRRNSPASLLATKSCNQADRDAYIWCYSRKAVNARRGAIQQNRI